MSARYLKTISFLALACAAACGDNVRPLTPDAGDKPDAMTIPDAEATPDAEAPLLPDHLADAIAATDGTQDPEIQINSVWVTYLKPLVGSDPAGFFVQREQPGPALFVAVDPETLSPPPAVGDRVSFAITMMGTVGAVRQAEEIVGFGVEASGEDVSALAQDVSNADDLVSALDDYTSELVTITGTITAGAVFAGSGHLKFDIDTAGLTADNVALRMPEAIVADLDLVVGCEFTTTPTPLWRYNDEAQPHIWNIAEIATATCPGPVVVGAVSTNNNTVIVEFNRDMDAASVVDPATQFAADNGLTVSAASVAGRFVTLTTSDQIGGDPYTVTVADTVTDIFGAGVDPANNTATFSGYLIPAVVRINELKANVTGGCDLIELRVISGGSLEGFQVWERTGSILTFDMPFSVATNDFIVVHTDTNDPNCNANSSPNETMAVDEHPNANFFNNFDSAFDWYTSDTGLTGTDNVFTVYDPSGAIVDAVLCANAPTGTAASGSESQAAVVAADGQWTNADGSVPPNGYIDDDFRANAVQGLADADTIQRIDDNDNNHMGDWTTTNQPETWGMPNAGQNPL